MIRRLLHLTVRNASQAGYCQKDVAAGTGVQKHLVQAPILEKWYSNEASLQKDVSSINEKGFKGHDMLAPFPAGWQMTDLNPLVIEKSEGSYVYDTKGKRYLDALAGLWCTALASCCCCNKTAKHIAILPLILEPHYKTVSESCKGTFGDVYCK